MQQKRHQKMNSKPTEETDCNLLSVDITMELQQTNNLHVKDEINKTKSYCTFSFKSEINWHS